jgi:homoserine kinase
VPPEIVVPASVSNLGPAFDTLAVALRLFLRVRVVGELPAGAGVDMHFVDAAPRGENRIQIAFDLAREEWGSPARGVRLEVYSDIPQRAGLGSSAAAAVAGLKLYEHLTAPRSVHDCLRLAARIEGHPDNAAAALLGGIVASCQRSGGEVMAHAWRWPADVRFVVATPHLELETGYARSVLPAEIPLRDAIFNLQRSMLLVRALETGAYGDLREAVRDRWHQPARARLVPVLDEALALDHPDVLAVFLAGSGPSIVALTASPPEEVAAALRNLYDRRQIACTIRTLEAFQPD